MAAATYAERIALDLQAMVPSQRMIALTQGPDAGTSENTTRTAAFAQIAAGTWVGKMGSPGAYDDSDGTVGNQVARSWGVRYAKHLLRDAFQLSEPDFSDQNESRLMAELEELAAGEREYAATPVSYDIDGDVVVPE
jgi:hypothetical protein